MVPNLCYLYLLSATTSNYNKAKENILTLCKSYVC